MSDGVVQAIVGGVFGVIIAMINKIGSKKPVEPPKKENRVGGSPAEEKMPFTKSRAFVWLVAPLGGALIASGFFLAGINGVRAVAGTARLSPPANPSSTPNPDPSPGSGIVAPEAPPGAETGVLKAPVSIREYFIPSGFMGDTDQIALNDDWTNNCHTPPTCVRAQYSPKFAPPDQGWAGVYWQYPENNWGEQEGRKIKGARKLVFWARGEMGGEIIKFGTGGNHKQFSDSLDKPLGKVTLSSQWQEFQIDLDAANTISVIGAFYWSAARDGNAKGAIFYLDDIYFR